MKIYYADNFRGFKQTFINIKQVNFFVGENTTGKTSILEMISLLNDINFWLNLDFNSGDVNLGTFEDILSKKSSSRFFTIGIFEKQVAKQKSTYTINLMKFSDLDGMSHLFEHILVVDNILISIRIEKARILYRYKEIGIINKDISDIDIFKQLLKIERSKAFRSLKFKVISEYPFMPILALSDFVIEKDKQLKKIVKYKFFLSGVSQVLLSSIAPIRAKPKSIYVGTRSPASPEGDHTPYIYKTLCEKDNISSKANIVLSTLNKYGKDSGLFDSIKVQPFGKKKTSPFELDIIRSNMAYKFSTVGYGISQIFPILVDLLSRPKMTIFSIQQPEVHLHPKAQAAFGQLIYELSIIDNKKFIIETHSDFMIDRFRYALSISDKKVLSQVLFFESTEDGNAITEIPINENGKYPLEQPVDFRSFFVNESIKTLEI